MAEYDPRPRALTVGDTVYRLRDLPAVVRGKVVALDKGSCRVDWPEGEATAELDEVALIENP